MATARKIFNNNTLLAHGEEGGLVLSGHGIAFGLQAGQRSIPRRRRRSPAAVLAGKRCGAGRARSGFLHRPARHQRLDARKTAHVLRGTLYFCHRFVGGDRPDRLSPDCYSQISKKP